MVKLASGAEAVLARSDKPLEPAAFDWQRNPMCPGWHAMSKLHAEERGLHQWRMERMRLQAVGQTLRAWLNGQEVLPAA